MTMFNLLIGVLFSTIFKVLKKVLYLAIIRSSKVLFFLFMEKMHKLCMQGVTTGVNVHLYNLVQVDVREYTNKLT